MLQKVIGIRVVLNKINDLNVLEIRQSVLNCARIKTKSQSPEEMLLFFVRIDSKSGSFLLIQAHLSRFLIEDK